MKRKDNFIPSFYINDQIMNWPPMGNMDEKERTKEASKLLKGN